MATTVPATTKSAARGDATAVRLSSGPAVSCVLWTDTGQTAEVRGKLWRGIGGHLVLLAGGAGAGLTSLQPTAHESVLPHEHWSSQCLGQTTGAGDLPS